MEKEKEVYEVNFDGNCLVVIEVLNNEIEVIKAMNGYGNAIELEHITIHKFGKPTHQ